MFNCIRFQKIVTTLNRHGCPRAIVQSRRGCPRASVQSRRGCPRASVQSRRGFAPHPHPFLTEVFFVFPIPPTRKSLTLSINQSRWGLAAHPQGNHRPYPPPRILQFFKKLKIGGPPSTPYVFLVVELPTHKEKFDVIYESKSVGVALFVLAMLNFCTWASSDLCWPVNKKSWADLETG